MPKKETDVQTELKKLRKRIKELEEDLKSSHEYARHIINSSLDMIITVDGDRRIVAFNKAAEKTLGYSAEEVLGKHIDVLYFSDAESLMIHETLREDGAFSGEIRNRRKDGTAFTSYLSASILQDGHGVFLGFMGISRDISERKRLEQQRIEELNRIALIDSLTELGNRRYAEMNLHNRVEEVRRYGYPCGLLFIDIDFFKEVNDNYGHGTGDRILQMTARILSGNIRSLDSVCRWGGEEFVVIVLNIDREKLISIAEKLRQLIEKSYIEVDGKHIGVTVSMGLTLAEREDTMDSLIERADLLMYQSKANGRNCITAG